MERVGLKGHVKLEVLDKSTREVVDCVEVDNFITETYRRAILDNTYSYLMSSGVPPTTPTYCCRNGTDKALKFAVAITDNNKVYNSVDKKKLRDVEGNIISVTTGVKSIGASDESFIESVNYLEDGGIEIKAVFRIGEGDINAVNLVIPADFDYNTDCKGLYTGIIGEQLVNSTYNHKSGDYFNTRFIKNGDNVYFGYTFYSPNNRYYIVKYNMKTKELSYVEKTSTKTTYTVQMQFIGDELYVIQHTDNIEVYDKDLNFLRVEGVKKSLSLNTNSGYLPECSHYFIVDDVVYAVDYVYSSNSTFRVHKTVLNSSDKVDYVTSRAISYTTLDAIKTVLLGDRIEGTTYIRALDGKVYDIEQLYSITKMVDWTPVDVECSEFEGRPAGLYRGIEIDDNVWMGVTFKNHDINRLSGLYTASSLVGGKHMVDNHTYADFGRYVTITTGGNALTHASLGQTITKTADNEIVITYTIK